MKYQAFVTISGQYEDTSWNYLDVSLESPLYDTFEEADRWHEAMRVKPFGAMAVSIHANHPEFVLLEAEYDICANTNDGVEYPIEDWLFGDDWFYNESIWWADEETYYAREEDKCL